MSDSPTISDERKVLYRKIADIRKRKRTNEATAEEIAFLADYVSRKKAKGRPTADESENPPLAKEGPEAPQNSPEPEETPRADVPPIDVRESRGQSSDIPPPKDGPPKDGPSKNATGFEFDFESLSVEFAKSWGNMVKEQSAECKQLGGVGISDKLVDAIIVPCTYATLKFFVIPEIEKIISDPRKAAPFIALGPPVLLYGQKKYLQSKAAKTSNVNRPVQEVPRENPPAPPPQSAPMPRAAEPEPEAPVFAMTISKIGA
jgi:hypothetical protein